jgi:hypothetical protein
MKTIVNCARVLMIVSSIVAAAFWALSASQPLTLSLDSMRDELIAAARYNAVAAWMACAAAVFQAFAAVSAFYGSRQDKG